MPTKAVVLGCGMVGATMARDLAADPSFEVTAADLDADRLTRQFRGQPAIRTQPVDLSNADQLRRLVEPFDVVLGALPSRFGFAALKTIVQAGKRFVDIAFMPENPLELDELAKRTGAVAVVDCGVSPGLSNMAVGHAHALMERTDRAVIYVGGLPKARHWPFQYRAPFAPSDVIEEYVRPARMRIAGKPTVKPALTDPELIDFPDIGTLEAFNTDGLRTLLDTTDIPDLIEKTMRYPGHIELMRVFREIGLFSREPIDIGGQKVRPLDLTSRLLFPAWTAEPGEREFTVLRVVVDGRSEGRPVRWTYDLYDETDAATGTSSMARTTAFPAAIVARMLVDGRFRDPGVHPPERIAQRPDLFDAVVSSLHDRGVRIERTVASGGGTPDS